jgi:hypothetical protein
VEDEGKTSETKNNDNNKSENTKTVSIMSDTITKVDLRRFVY